MSRATINKQLNIRNNGNPFVGQSDLAVEYWDRDILGVGSPFTYSGASGETYSNAYGTNKCQQSCKGLFPLASEGQLLKACEKTCKYECNRKSKCPDSYEPTRENVCLKAGLSSDCKQSSWSDTPSPSPSGGTSPTTTTTTSGGGMSMGTKVGITLGILAVLGTAGYFIFRKK